MKKSAIKYRLLSLALFAFFAACSNTGPFSELGDNRLSVIIKGTYESGNPMPFNTAPGAALESLTVVKAPLNPPGITDVMPNMFMMDIAEMRLVDIHGKQHKFANYRQALANVMNEGNPFFNGQGLVLRNDDVKNGVYTHVLLYLRRVMFDGAKQYRPTVSTAVAPWTFVQDMPSVFAEVPFYGGYDFILAMINTYYDTLRYESLYINRVYPLVVPIEGGLIYEGAHTKSTVLEIRLVVKNYVKKYEAYSFDSLGMVVSHYYNFSDWLRKVRPDETIAGGNILTVGRAYIPGATGSIAGTAAAGSWVIAVPAGSNINDYTIPILNPRDAAALVNSCDLPLLPSIQIGGIEQALDSYIKYENYNSQYRTCMTNCTTSTQYETAWTDYENAVTNFKIPPHATYTLTGTYSLDCLSPGSYDVYRAAAPNYGELISEGGFSSLGTNVTVSIGAITPVP